MSVDETLSTLQYAQSAHGIVNKPTASSMLKLNVDGAARPSAAGGARKEQSQQDTPPRSRVPMHYLDTQAEEAAAALARNTPNWRESSNAPNARRRRRAAGGRRSRRTVVEVKRASGLARRRRGGEGGAGAAGKTGRRAPRYFRNRDAIIAARGDPETKN